MNIFMVFKLYLIILWPRKDGSVSVEPFSEREVMKFAPQR